MAWPAIAIALLALFILREVVLNSILALLPGWVIRHVFWPLMYFGSYHPALLISFLALLFHPSLPWLLTVICAWVLFVFVQSFFNLVISVKNMREATREFLDQASGFTLQEVDTTSFFDLKSFPILQTRSMHRQIVGEGQDQEAVQGLPGTFHAHPLRVFVVARRDGALVGAVKAYLSPLGASFIFLARTPDSMNANQRFLLQHELEHVSTHGAPQFTLMRASRIWGLIGIVFASSIATSWFHWMGIAAYALGWLLTCWSMPIMREVIADNGALNKIADPAQRELVSNDTLEIFRDHLRSGAANQPGRAFGFKRRMELTFRIKNLEEIIRHGAKIPLHAIAYFYHLRTHSFLIIYVPAFVHLAIVTKQPPFWLTVLMVCSALAAFLAAAILTKRSIPAFKQVDEILSPKQLPAMG